MHLFNAKLGQKLKPKESSVHKGEEDSGAQYVSKFGFHTTTCCGYLPQDNTWENDWVVS